MKVFALTLLLVACASANLEVQQALENGIHPLNEGRSETTGIRKTFDSRTAFKDCASVIGDIRDQANCVRIFVDSTINRYKVTVFSKTFCPYCRRAKELLFSYPIKEDCLKIIELEKRPDMSQIQSYLKELTGASSVPRIFVNAVSLGGCDDVTKLHKSGELKRLLQECDCLKQ